MRNIVVLFGLLLIASIASANTVTLTFEGLQDRERILNYYNGGTGQPYYYIGNGSGPGPNYGVSFTSNSIALTCLPGLHSCSSAPSPDAVMMFMSSTGAVVSTDATMNVAAGFDTGFSFFYWAQYSGNVYVWSGPDGTGTLLASGYIPYSNWNCDGLTPASCWKPLGVSFGGTAQSVVFHGFSASIAFDNVTLGSSTPGAVPEPATFLLFGTGALAILVRRRR